jgi:hypothetical protein
VPIVVLYEGGTIMTNARREAGLVKVVALAALAAANVPWAGGCGDVTSETTTPGTPPGGDDTPPGTVEQGLDLVVHEWGTFTSVQDSLGRTRDGLHHEDEPLPDFVHARDIGSPYAKRMESIPQTEAVTQKLETPVVYFYGERAANVRIDVDFPAGIVSEWYPAAATFEPAVVPGALARMGGGRMTWDVALRPGALDAALPPVAPDSVWAPSRNVDATPVRIAGEDELFIFYRGLGRFEMPVRVTSTGSTDVVIENDSDDVIPAAFLLWVHAQGASITPLGPVAARGHVTAAPTPKERDAQTYLAEAQAVVAEALRETGLYADEARAMVDTWASSYFLTHGLRVLYVVPRPWTDALLPMRVEPAPLELVRTLVGRIEVMTPAVETQVVAQVEEAARTGRRPDLVEIGRFAEPRLRRAAELITDPVARALCDELIVTATSMP